MGGASWKLGAGKRVVTCKVRGRACSIQLGQPDCRHAGAGGGGGRGVSVHLPGKPQTGSPRPWNSSHQRPAPSPTPLPLPGAIVHGLCYISGLGRSSTQPFLWKTWISQFALLKYLAADSENCTHVHILTYGSCFTGSEMVGFQP